ncbi:MAG: TIGR03617 family F420-dependent LLM class oxidoreductase [Myxococcota bacterium]|jgi:probable F420-dependent oxidoreductase|nr:LLM class F420-dependent oxidoreductase [Deltaproteobacteria bacterium]MCP4244757.1 TIGR03617 family F420-dependent LLM class oxidoreductase [bacterium]MDP6073478.1 TIGR03617 family F420-dependent LLM class oxidoreductase [Myxococcota bacterium]MDP6244694.1 TIGR03617 family F420-dependent LLM class oxidoreductase [Myxococcota bacterium]MDP7075191.1 TIGR03617 family F420-dependent LLM class oxidoreductase [Myxococcota bacterium]
MRIEATITDPPNLQELSRHGRRLDEIGFDTILFTEAGHDPFLPAMTLAEHTERTQLGTGIAIAFPRSPFVTAQIAWDLQRYTGGRFLLGLGTQVKGHNERRYSTPWPSPPGPRLREYILCLRAIFETFQTGARPEFVGEHYQFTLDSPFFNPGPNPDGGRVPLYVSAVNRYNCCLAGELCDGIRMHPLNTARYIEEVIRPAVSEGARKAGRELSEIDFAVNPFVITGEDAEALAQSRELIRRHISFYAATRAYSGVMDLHGWGKEAAALVRLSTQGRWDDMPALVTDEMLDELAVSGSLEELPAKLEERFAGLVTSINLVFGPPYAELQERQRGMFESLEPIMQALKQI